MSQSELNREKKQAFIKKIYEYFSIYKSVVLVSLTNVSSNQVQNIRKDLVKVGAELVIGKNTVIATALKLRAAALDAKNPEYEFFKRYCGGEFGEWGWGMGLGNLGNLGNGVGEFGELLGNYWGGV